MSLLSEEAQRELKTTAINALVNYYTNEPATVTRYDGYNEIHFSPAQAKRLRALLDQWMKSEEGDIRINVKPVLLPWIIKRYGIYVISGLGGLLLLGRLTQRRYK